MKYNPSIDRIIVDMIMDHYNQQSYSGQNQSLSSTDFDDICGMAEAVYLKKIVIQEKPALA